MGSAVIISLLAIGIFLLMYTLIFRVQHLPRMSLIVAAIWMTFGYNHTVPSEMARLVFIATQGILVMSVIFSPRGGFRLTHVWLPLVWYAVNIAATLSTNQSSALQLFQFAILSCATIWNMCIMRRQDVAKLVKGLVLLGFVHAVFGLMELWTHAPVLWGYATRGSGFFTYSNPLFAGSIVRIQGTLGHPIPFSVMIGLASILLISYWRQFSVLARWSFLSVFILAAIFNGTRSMFVGLAVACLIHLFSHHTKHKFAKWLAVAVAAWVVYIADFGMRESVSNLINSGSFENRAEAIESVPGLFERTVFEVIFGSGFGSEQTLFDAGFLQQSGFGVVDNQLVTSFATSGIFGVLGLLAILGVAFIRSEIPGRRLIVFMTIMMFSFDYLRWATITYLLFLVIGFAVSGAKKKRASAPGSRIAAPPIHYREGHFQERAS